MGRQWLQAKREVANLKKGQVVGKLVKEIMVAAKLGGPDPAGNARLFTAVEKARRENVTRDVIERAIKKGAGTGDEKLVLEHVVFEGYAPNKVPVIVEVMTDNKNRTAPDMRLLFKAGQLGTAGSNKFLFDHVGIIEAHHPGRRGGPGSRRHRSRGERLRGADPRAERRHSRGPLPGCGCWRTDRRYTAFSQWLSANGWTVVTSEIGYVAKSFPELDGRAKGARPARSCKSSTTTTTWPASGRR